MFWYFFIEMFDQFRNFFLVVFQLHTFIFVAPLCIKIRYVAVVKRRNLAVCICVLICFANREHPIFVIIVLSGIMSILKSYPSVGDAALFLGLLPVHDELFKCKSPMSII